MASEERGLFYGPGTCLIEDMYRLRLILLRGKKKEPFEICDEVTRDHKYA